MKDAKQKVPKVELRPAPGSPKAAKKIRRPVTLSLCLLKSLAAGPRSFSGLLNASKSLHQDRNEVRRALQELTAEGLVHGQGEGLYRLTPTGRKWLISILPPNKPKDQPKAEPAEMLAIDPDLLDDVGGFVADPELWFRTPNSEFEWRKPIEMLGTPDEARLRNRIMGAKLGMFS